MVGVYDMMVDESLPKFDKILSKLQVLVSRKLNLRLTYSID